MQQTLSTLALIKSAVIALIVAGLVLVSFILPAEYNIDPTGLGEKLGLTSLAKTNVTGAEKSTEDSKTKQASDTVEVIVPANRGVEFKFSMQQFQKMEYEWQTDGEPLYFDLHGEPEGDTTGYFESYAIATLKDIKGSFTAPFAGSHGWYWKNTTNNAVTVKLIVKGEYTIIGLKK